MDILDDGMNILEFSSEYFFNWNASKTFPTSDSISVTFGMDRNVLCVDPKEYDIQDSKP